MTQNYKQFEEHFIQQLEDLIEKIKNDDINIENISQTADKEKVYHTGDRFPTYFDTGHRSLSIDYLDKKQRGWLE